MGWGGGVVDCTLCALIFENSAPTSWRLQETYMCSSTAGQTGLFWDMIKQLTEEMVQNL